MHALTDFQDVSLVTELSELRLRAGKAGVRAEVDSVCLRVMRDQLCEACATVCLRMAITFHTKSSLT